MRVAGQMRCMVPYAVAWGGRIRISPHYPVDWAVEPQPPSGCPIAKFLRRVRRVKAGPTYGADSSLRQRPCTFVCDLVRLLCTSVHKRPCCVRDVGYLISLAVDDARRHLASGFSATVGGAA